VKTRYILLIVILLVLVVYLWSAKNNVQESLDYANAKHRAQDFEHITIIMKNSIPDTLDLYNNNFTEKELSLYKHSLANAISALDLKRTKLTTIEYSYDNDYNLSESIEEFQFLMYEIIENAGAIDEDIFYQMGDLITDYSNELGEKNYREESVQDFFDQSTKLVNEMNQKIRDLVKTDSQ